MRSQRQTETEKKMEGGRKGRKKRYNEKEPKRKGGGEEREGGRKDGEIK